MTGDRPVIDQLARYTAHPFDLGGDDFGAEMRPDAEGEYVKWSDVLDLLAAVLPRERVEPTICEVELEAARLKLRLYENGTSPNQPLVDDIERFRQEAVQAMRQRDSTQGTNNKMRKELAASAGERERLRAEINERIAAYQQMIDANRDVAYHEGGKQALESLLALLAVPAAATGGEK
jgi:hypothetical protein